jgi:hypothetical protein
VNSFEGTVVVQAAFNEESVKTEVTLFTQSYGIGPAFLLPEGRSVHLIHGRAGSFTSRLLSIMHHIILHMNLKDQNIQKTLMI